MDFEKYLSSDFNKYILKSEEYIEKYKQKALTGLDCLEDNIYKKTLVDIINYTLRS